MSTRDEGPGFKNPQGKAILEEDDDALDGSADETRQYRPVSLDAAAQRLGVKQQFSELAKLADFVPMKPPAAGTRAPVLAPPTIPPAPAPAPPRQPAAHVLYVPDRTIQAAPIAPAFADALTATAEGPFARVRWAVVVSMLSVALPAGLLLLPASAKPPAARLSEPAPQSQVPAAGPSAHSITEAVIPQVSVSAPRPARHARGAATSKPAAGDLDSNPSPNRPTQTPER
jgi:hypothetical protein